MKLTEIITPFLKTDNTCEEVIEYFEKGNKAESAYIDLANYFIDDNYAKHSEGDTAYKEWLKKLIDDNRENESIILSALKTEYQTKESLKEFVFTLNGMSPQLNQKWHFFISYWGLREYITKYPKNNFDRLTPLKNGDEANKGNPFKKCEEGKIWFDQMVKKFNIE